MNLKRVKRAIISVFDKSNLETILPTLKKFKIQIISSLNHTTKNVMKTLQEKKIASKKKKKIKHEFFVSDLTESFQKSANLFFNKKVILKEKNIFNLTHTI